MILQSNTPSGSVVVVAEEYSWLIAKLDHRSFYSACLPCLLLISLSTTAAVHLRLTSVEKSAFDCVHRFTPCFDRGLLLEHSL